MYRLRDLKNGLFQIHSTKYKEAYEGTPRSLFAHAIKMGIPQNELTKAVNELASKEADYAEFGTQGKFICVKKNPKN